MQAAKQHMRRGFGQQHLTTSLCAVNQHITNVCTNSIYMNIGNISYRVHNKRNFPAKTNSVYIILTLSEFEYKLCAAAMCNNFG